MPSDDEPVNGEAIESIEEIAMINTQTACNDRNIVEPPRNTGVRVR